MKHLGIDYGSKRVGTAVSDDEGKIAFPRVVVPNNEKLLETILALIKKENAQKVVIGDARGSGGAENPVTKDVEAFAKALEAQAGIPVELVSEIWSSIEAARYSENAGDHNDASAAAIILQRYLDGLVLSK